MNNQNELIKRIDEIFSDQDYVKSRITPRVEQALRDCLAEIERLKAETDHLTLALEATVLVRNNQSRQIDELKNEIERLGYRIAELERPYVPMVDDELLQVWSDCNYDDDANYGYEKHVETTTIKRYNEQRGVK